MESKFKVTIEKTQTKHEISIEQYGDDVKISQVSILGDNEDYDHNLENMRTIALFLTDLMRRDLRQHEQIGFLLLKIDEAERHSKTDICKKVFKQIRADYNDFLLGHRRERRDD